MSRHASEWRANAPRLLDAAGRPPAAGSAVGSRSAMPVPPPPSWRASSARPRALDPPFAVVDLDAYRANAQRHAAARRTERRSDSRASRSAAARCSSARSPPIPASAARSRSRCPRRCGSPTSGLRDLVVAYPTADRGALRALAAREDDAGIAVMVDDVAQLELIEAAVAEAGGGGAPGTPIRVCIDADASWRPLGGRVHVGVKRSPLHTPEQVAALAREIVARPALELVGVMAYEAQIAGLGDRPPGKTAARDRAARRAARLGARARRTAGGDRRGGAGGRTARARQRRRHGIDRVDRGGAGRDRGGRRLRPLRPDAVRRLLAFRPAARRRCSRCRSCAAPAAAS